MACNQSTSFRIDCEWAGSLKGLRMNVPDDWWDGFTGHKLNGGVIARVDFGIDGNKYFQLELDGERGAYYPMRYDAVVRYADKTHRAFSSFRLPAHAVSDPAQEVVVVEETVDDNDNDDADDDDYFTTPPPAAARNKRQRLNSKQMTINPDLSKFVEEGTADGGPVPTRRRRERAAATPGMTAAYKMTAHVDWTKISVESPGRHIEPIPYTGENEFFGVNMSNWKIEQMKDEHGDIRYDKIFEWMLPTIREGESFWRFLAARMRSYMSYLMLGGWKPRWFDPDKGTIIEDDHVARMFGCQQCRSI